MGCLRAALLANTPPFWVVLNFFDKIIGMRLTRRKPFLWILFLILMSLGCNLARSLVQQPVGSPTATLAAAATLVAPVSPTPPPSPVLPTPTNPGVEPTATLSPLPTSESLSFFADEIQLVLPASLAVGVEALFVPAVAPGGSSPPWEVMPAHLQYALEGYPLQDTLHSPVVFVYPLAAIGRYNPGAANQENQLRGLLDGAAASSPLPFLPVFNAAQVFHSNLVFLNFQNGSGIRYLTQFGQDAGQLNNHSLFYTYQGLTADGAYYVAVILPIHSAILPARSADTAIPPGGEPFPDYSSTNFPAAYERYLEAIKIRLENQPAASFNPSLETLDALVMSLRVTGSPELTPACLSLLQQGGRAYVNPNPPTSNRLRNGAGVGTDVRATLGPGTVVELLKGPVCTDGLVFWEVNVPSLAITGWTAESDFESQWLLACPGEGSCPP